MRGRLLCQRLRSAASQAQLASIRSPAWQTVLPSEPRSEGGIPMETRGSPVRDSAGLKGRMPSRGLDVKIIFLFFAA